MERMPIYADAGIRRIVNGAISHTPDSNPLVGPAPGVRNFWLATGSGIGIAQGPGCGRFLAQQMVHGDSEINMLGMDPRRFGDFCDQAYASAKAHREYWDMYRLVPPGEERRKGRPAKTTPLHDKLLAKGCVFTEGFGWERPKWFSLDGREEDGTFVRNNTFEVVGAECRAVRERASIMELPSFATFEISGPGAEAFLDRLCANRMPRREGGIVLAHTLSENGRYATEFTVTRLPGDRFFILAGAVAYQRDLDLMRGALRPEDEATIIDVTMDRDTLIVAGPRSRELLTKLTTADLGSAAFPWLTGKEIEVAGIGVLALRVNYVGELGWELHVPMDWVAGLYDAVGRGAGPRHRRLRPVRHEQPADGEGLPRLGFGPDQRDHAGRGRADALREARPRVHRPFRRRGRAGAGGDDTHGLPRGGRDRLRRRRGGARVRGREGRRRHLLGRLWPHDGQEPGVRVRGQRLRSPGNAARGRPARTPPAGHGARPGRP